MTWQRILSLREDSGFSTAASVARCGGVLLGRAAMGFLAAAYVCVAMVFLLVVAAILGVGLVRCWIEDPIDATENLYLDYADSHPTAVVSFSGHVPVGQTLYVSLVLSMPDSDYNRDIGIFQVNAEILSTGGNLVAKSSHPCMLQFQSRPIRALRTFLMTVPLLLGITEETQTLTFPILSNKERSSPRTREIRVTLIPRAGTRALPQFYEAKIVLKSRMPWAKQVVYTWKWTFYVWTTLYIYTIMLAMVLAIYLKPVINSVVLMASNYQANMELGCGYEEADSGRDRVEGDVSFLRRTWQPSKSKRKADGLLWGETGPSVSSTTVTSGPAYQGVGDSQSMCFPD